MSSEKRDPPRKVAVATLGCKVNQFESASFVSEFSRLGFAVVPATSAADIYVINTCAVTAKAAAQSRQLIRRVLKRNPVARLVVTGCYAQIANQEIVEMVDRPLCLVGNADKHRVVEVAASEIQCDLEMHLSDVMNCTHAPALPVIDFPGRTRAYLKVQDGCSQFCSYCVVPFARGRSRSIPAQEVLLQAERFAGQGFREIVLTGIHLGHYGLDLSPRKTLLDLVDMLLGLRLDVRYRLSSLEPTEITEGLLERMRERRIMPHLHVPLQSGDDEILLAMNRRYSRKMFAETVGRALADVPGLAVGVDVLVGFPGEEERHFRNTCELLESLPVAYLHVFPYSPRPHTLAARLPGQVHGKVKEERVARLRDLDHKKRVAFYRNHLHTVHQVLAESRRTRLRMIRGFTENYIPVFFKAPESKINTVLPVRIDRVDQEGVFGSVVPQR